MFFFSFSLSTPLILLLLLLFFFFFFSFLFLSSPPNFLSLFLSLTLSLSVPACLSSSLDINNPNTHNSRAEAKDRRTIECSVFDVQRANERMERNRSIFPKCCCDRIDHYAAVRRTISLDRRRRCSGVYVHDEDAARRCCCCFAGGEERDTEGGTGFFETNDELGVYSRKKGGECGKEGWHPRK